MQSLARGIPSPAHIKPGSSLHRDLRGKRLAIVLPRWLCVLTQWISKGGAATGPCCGNANQMKRSWYHGHQPDAPGPSEISGIKDEAVSLETEVGGIGEITANLSSGHICSTVLVSMCLFLTLMKHNYFVLSRAPTMLWHCPRTLNGRIP